jgi:hypothetical protein
MPAFAHPFRSLGLAAAAALLGGCAAQTPNLDRQFGYAVTAARMQQALAPSVPAQQMATLDGKTAKAGYDNYQKSFQEPQSQAGALTIGIGR